MIRTRGVILATTVDNIALKIVFTKIAHCLNFLVRTFIRLPRAQKN